jgi:hypothetical protein
MDLKENTNGIIGKVSITRMNAMGDILEKIYIPNLVVDIGRSYIASRIIGTTPAIMTHMALGSGATAPVGANTTLGTELGRVALTTSTSLNNVVTYTATFPAGTATGAIQEAAIFNAASAGTMLCRTTFSVVNKSASDIIAVSWTVTVA